LKTRAAISPPERLEMADANASSVYMFDALVQGRADEAASFPIKQYLHGRPPSHIFDETLAPAMRRVGDLWYRRDLTVAREHLATRTAVTAVYRLRDVMLAREANRLVAICCGMEGDFHDLPVQLSQVLLESEGWQAVSLGANTPFFALTEAMLRHARRWSASRLPSSTTRTARRVNMRRCVKLPRV
jgi:methanogenic corrinoid protein MtbC1